MGRVELSDLISVYDPLSHERMPVERTAVVSGLREIGQRRGARIVAGFPVDADGVLDPGAVDETLRRAHCEMQRLYEEIHHGPRVARLLGAALGAVRRTGAGGRLVVVDVGCGLGYVPRWLAATGVLGDDVELIGVDQDRALVEEARALAAVEGLAVRFEHGDAFAVGAELGADLYISSCVLHHVPVDRLAAFFAAQDRPGVKALLHWDIAPTWLAPLGAWLFHRARMREPLARHDGFHSALRSHSDTTLGRAMAAAAPLMSVAVFDPVHLRPVMLNVLRPVLGLRPELVEDFVDLLDEDRGRLQLLDQVGGW